MECELFTSCQRDAKRTPALSPTPFHETAPESCCCCCLPVHLVACTVEHCAILIVVCVGLWFALQDIKVEGLDVMKVLMERRKAELKEEEEAAEAKQRADREARGRRYSLHQK